MRTRQARNIAEASNKQQQKQHTEELPLKDSSSGHSNIVKDSNAYKDLDTQRLLKLESLGKGGFGEVAVYYDHTLQQALAVKEFQNEQHYLEEKERNTNCNILQDRNRYFASMLSFSDSRHMIFYELGDCTLLEINNLYIQQNYLQTQILSSIENASKTKIKPSEEQHSHEDKFQTSSKGKKGQPKKLQVEESEQQKWKEIDLIYVTYSLLNIVYYMRENKMFHGDISPDNIMIFQNRLKFIDLGSSHLNNNQFYLKQYKRQFVNFDIMNSQKKYSDNDISQNEMYALGRTITHLCLYISAEREEIIVNRNLTLAQLKQKFRTFQSLMESSKSLQHYPNLSRILLKMQYPFDPAVQCKFEELKVDMANKKQERIIQQQSEVIKLSRQASKRSSKRRSTATKSEDLSSENQISSNSALIDKQGVSLNSKRFHTFPIQVSSQNSKNKNETNSQKEDQIELKYTSGRGKKVKKEEIKMTNLSDTSVEKSNMMTTVIFSEEEQNDVNQSVDFLLIS